MQIFVHKTAEIEACFSPMKITNQNKKTKRKAKQQQQFFMSLQTSDKIAQKLKDLLFLWHQPVTLKAEETSYFDKKAKTSKIH